MIAHYQSLQRPTTNPSDYHSSSVATCTHNMSLERLQTLHLPTLSSLGLLEQQQHLQGPPLPGELTLPPIRDPHQWDRPSAWPGLDVSHYAHSFSPLSTIACEKTMWHPVSCQKGIDHYLSLSYVHPSRTDSGRRCNSSRLSEASGCWSDPSHCGRRLWMILPSHPLVMHTIGIGHPHGQC
jgi:hypothetical protein